MSGRWGEVTRGRVVGQEGTRPVQGGMPFNPPNCQGITKKQEPCSGPRAKGTLYCVGHLRQRGELDG